MECYWNNRPKKTMHQAPTEATDAPDPSATSLVQSNFDCYRQSLLNTNDKAEEHWQSELRRYLKEFLHDVTKDTNIIEWWQVSSSLYHFILY